MEQRTTPGQLGKRVTGDGASIALVIHLEGTCCDQGSAPSRRWKSSRSVQCSLRPRERIWVGAARQLEVGAATTFPVVIARLVKCIEDFCKAVDFWASRGSIRPLSTAAGPCSTGSVETTPGFLNLLALYGANAAKHRVWARRVESRCGAPGLASGQSLRIMVIQSKRFPTGPRRLTPGASTCHQPSRSFKGASVAWPCLTWMRRWLGTPITTATS